MRRRKSKPDKYIVGRSSLVPYLASEGWQDRHSRRKEDALQNKRRVESWCNNHKWKVYVANNGHHWMFTTHQQKRIEWFPSSGKLVIGKRWDSGIHCHDYKQLLQVFEHSLKGK